jgi:hypothetical protein
VVPGKQPIPLGRVTLLVTFRDSSNYRTETLAFEVVDFSGPYHIILGQPRYVKFMDIPSYAYRKLKIPGLRAGQHRAGYHCGLYDQTKGAQPPDTYNAAQFGHAHGI